MRARGIVWPLLLLPVAISLFFVLHLAVDVPWGDQWDILPPLLEQSGRGALDWAALAAPHNEHRILFPRLVMLGLARLTRWDTRAEMLLIQLMLLLVLLLLAGRLSSGAPAWLLPLPWLVFNLKQWETMLFGVQIAYILPVLAALLALDRLERLDTARRPVLAFAAAVAAAGVASFSMLAGLLVWPAGALLLGLGDRRRRPIYLPLWLTAAGAAWAAYFAGLPAGSGAVAWAAAHPPALTRFMLALLGNALIARRSAALLAGALLCLLMLLVAFLLTRRRAWRVNRFWVCVAAFALLCLGAIAAGRAWAGTEAALAPRYTTFSLLLLAALYALLAGLSRSGSQRRLPLAALAGLLLAVLASLPISLQRGWAHGQRLHDRQQRLATTLRGSATLPDAALVELHPDPLVVRRGSSLLEKLGYSVFRDREPARGE